MIEVDNVRCNRIDEINWQNFIVAQLSIIPKFDKIGSSYIIKVFQTNVSKWFCLVKNVVDWNKNKKDEPNSRNNTASIDEDTIRKVQFH